MPEQLIYRENKIFTEVFDLQIPVGFWSDRSSDFGNIGMDIRILLHPAVMNKQSNIRELSI